MKKVTLFCVITLLSCMVNAEPPATSGIVTRGGFNDAWWLVDDSSGMGLVIGADIVEFCSGTVDFGFHSYADKDIQEGLRLVTIEKADDQVTSVWPFTEFNCERFLTELPIATGEAQFRLHDNDFFGLRYCDIKNNMNAWGYSVHGTLYSLFGEKRQLSANFWGIFDCDTESFPVSKAKIVLTD